MPREHFWQKISDPKFLENGGWGGIRTHETLSRLPVFKTGAFNRSATHPLRGYFTKMLRLEEGSLTTKPSISGFKMI